MATTFGPTFGDEVIAAGLGGLPFAWANDGTITGRQNLTTAQNSALDAVIAAHNPLRPLVPDTVTALQARRAMRAAGLYTTILAAVNASTDPDVQDSWQYASLWHRDAHWIATLSVQLNLTSAQVDALFIQAAGL